MEYEELEEAAIDIFEEVNSLIEKNLNLYVPEEDYDNEKDWYEDRRMVRSIIKETLLENL